MIIGLTFQLPGWLKENEFWINMFAYSHAMINPIIYITFNENFKKSFKKFLCCSNEIIPNEYSRNCKYAINFNMLETLSPLSILFDCYQNFQIILNIYECDELFLSIQLPNLVD